MSTKKLICFVVFIAACNTLIPEPLVERARLACEPYGGVRSIAPNTNSRKGIVFWCNNGDEHHLIVVQPEKAQ